MLVQVQHHRRENLLNALENKLNHHRQEWQWQPLVSVVKSQIKRNILKSIVHYLRHSNSQKRPLQSQLVDDYVKSDVLEYEVKVCDICGDAGLEELLSTYTQCNEGGRVHLLHAHKAGESSRTGLDV